MGLVLAEGLPADERAKLRSMDEIVCLQDGSAMEGTFFLFGGHIEDRMVYTYYHQVNGSHYLKQINAEGVAIKYTLGKPRAVCYVMKLDGLRGKNRWAVRLNMSESDKKTEIYVPEGSIKSGFQLDAR